MCVYVCVCVIILAYTLISIDDYAYVSRLTLYSVHYVYSKHYTVQCTLYTLVLYTVHCTVCSIIDAVSV